MLNMICNRCCAKNRKKKELMLYEKIVEAWGLSLCKCPEAGLSVGELEILKTS